MTSTHVVGVPLDLRHPAPHVRTMRVTTFRGPEQIAQEDLDRYLYLCNQVREVRQQRNKLARDLLERLMGGAEVESGTHVAWIAKKSKGQGWTARLKVR